MTCAAPAPEPDVVTVTVIVVTWNSERHVAELLQTLPDAMLDVPAWQLVVVDNDSRDRTIDIVRRVAPYARVVQTGRNAGYAAGINCGISAAGPSEAYLVLNPDIRMARGSCRPMLEALRVPGVGIVTPRLLDESDRTAPSLRRRPSLIGIFAEAVLGGRLAGRLPGVGEMMTSPRVYRAPRDVDWATGALLLFSADCLARVGSWDESFFLYSEETDFALRAHDAGLRVRYVPDARAVHVGGDVHRVSSLYALLVTNRVRCFAKRHGRLQTSLFRLGLITFELVRQRDDIHRSAYRALRNPAEVV